MQIALHFWSLSQSWLHNAVIIWRDTKHLNEEYAFHICKYAITTGSEKIWLLYPFGEWGNSPFEKITILSAQFIIKASSSFVYRGDILMWEWMDEKQENYLFNLLWIFQLNFCAACNTQRSRALKWFIF